MTHFTMSCRVPAITEAGFKCQEGEVFPEKEYYESERFEALLEYIGQPGLCGYMGDDASKTLNLKTRKDLHVDGQAYMASNGQIITREEGWKADQWAGRHFNAYLKEHYPPQLFEVVWNRSPLVTE